MGNFEESITYKNYTIQNINLGIKEIYDPKYTLSQDIESVIIEINGYQYTYNYGGKQLEIGGVPQVFFENKSIEGVYQRPVYPSDIYMLKDDTINDNDNNNKLKVYVKYGINISNPETLQNSSLYEEQQLVITNLTEKVDPERFTLDTKHTDVNSGWKEKDGTYIYNENITIEPGKAIMKYIQFEVKDKVIRDILENEDKEENYTKTTANTIGYHEYKRDDYSWKNKNHEQKNPKKQDHITVNTSNNDAAPFMKFTLANDRIITGNAFEDNKDNNKYNANKEVIGNGTKDEGEKAVEDVIVELLQSDGTPAKRYYKEDDVDNSSGTTEGVTTGDNGSYVLKGVLPGKYRIRFTYKDGTTKIVDGENRTDISIDDYKSTIVTAEEVKNAIVDERGYPQPANMEWYKYIEDKYKKDGISVANVAVDDLNFRVDYNTNGIDNENWGNKQMIAATPLTSITIENTKNTTSNEPIIIIEENDKEFITNKYEFSGFNFGIVRQPVQKLTISKKAVEVKIETTSGINGIPAVNPKNANTQGVNRVADLDGTTDGGSLYTRMEMDTDKIYGAALYVTYDLTIQNDSEVNYYETDKNNLGWYYMFGETGDSYSKLVAIDVEEVLDCFDPVMTPVTNLDNIENNLQNKNVKDIGKNEDIGREHKQEVIKISDISNAADNISNTEYVKNKKRMKSINAQLEGEDGIQEQKGRATSSYKQVISLTGTGIVNKGRTAERYVLTTTLLTPQDELYYLNIAGISKAKVSAQNKNDANNDNVIESLKYVMPLVKGAAYIQPEREPTTSEIVEVIIINPTGSNRFYIATISTVSAIAVLSIMSIGLMIYRKKHNI